MDMKSEDPPGNINPDKILVIPDDADEAAIHAAIENSSMGWQSAKN